MMTQVYLGVGSNVDPENYITVALEALSDSFGDLSLSSVYESESIGFKGDNFFNMVVGVNTRLPVEKLSELLKSVEDANGRDRNSSKYSGRTLDIDILLYGDLSGFYGGVELPRGEITFNAFVLRPLAELAPTNRHPESGLSYEQMWRNYNCSQQLWPVDFIWRERQISFAS